MNVIVENQLHFYIRVTILFFKNLINESFTKKSDKFKLFVKFVKLL